MIIQKYEIEKVGSNTWLLSPLVNLPWLLQDGNVYTCQQQVTHI